MFANDKELKLLISLKFEKHPGIGNTSKNTNLYVKICMLTLSNKENIFPLLAVLFYNLLSILSYSIIYSGWS